MPSHESCVTFAPGLRRWLGVIAVAAGLASVGCSEEVTGPEPGLSQAAQLPVDPGLICQMQHPEAGTPVVVRGQNFAPAAVGVPDDPAAALPTLSLVRTRGIDGSSAEVKTVTYGSESDGPNAGLLRWQSQSQLTFNVTDSLTLADGSTGMLPIGLYDVQVTNLNGETASSATSFGVVDRPRVGGVEPGLVCVDDGAKTITITGQTILRIGQDQAVVRIDGQDFAVDSTSGCTAIDHPGLDAEFCDSVTVTVDGLSPGFHDVVIANPETAACESVPAEDDVKLRVVAAPTIDSIEPQAICRAGTTAVDVVVSGSGFLQVDGESFTVSVAGTEATPTDVTGCTDVEVQGSDVQSCTGFTVAVDAATMDVGGVEITVSNPGPGACSTTTSEMLAITDPPTISSIQPDEICSDQVETVTITGTDFAQDARVFVGGTEATSVDVSDDGISMSVEMPGLAPGTYDVTVDNGSGCESTATAAFSVEPTPLVFFVDPPVVYNGISVEVTVFTTGLDAAASQVELVADDGTATVLNDLSSDPGRPNRILATIPFDANNPLAPGVYDVRVSSDIGCQGTLEDAVSVVDTLTIELESVDPAFVSPTTATAVTVTAQDASAQKFAATPRVYLNPADTTGGAVAVGLRAVEFIDDTTLNAVVPGGLTAGEYDVIVVNPTGEVGLLPAALTVTAAEPPLVTDVAPATFDSNTTGQQATIFGEHFGTDVGNMAVTTECRDFATGQPAATNATVAIDNSTAEALDVTVDTTGVDAGTVCVIVVTNPDGASFRYSAVSVKEPAQNLNPWAAAPEMLEPRRALALEAGRPTNRSRFLYAIGGDEGTTATAKTSVEATSVGSFGGLAGWTLQRNSLANVWDTTAQTSVAAPRTFAEGAQIGRFIYVVGGSNGTDAQASVLRAQILDPLATPEVNDLDAELEADGSQGLSSGLWYYRVAAVFPGDDPSNPGGESLPGELLPVQLPDISPQLISLVLTWDPVAGASGYRVYRTPVADDDQANLQLIGETTGGSATSLTDTGLSADATQTPLPFGSLGVWHTVAPLNTARQAHATVAVADPADPTRYFLYAAGGYGTGGAALDSIEYTTVDIAADGSQTLGGWANTTATLGAARAELGGFAVTGQDTTVVPAGEAYVYFGQGRANNMVSTMEAAQIGVDGDLASIASVSGPTPARAGYVNVAANGWLFMLGGSNGTASNGNDTSSEVIGPPALAGWDALGGGAMLIPRIYADGAEESAFFFIAGGENSSGALTAVSKTIQ